MKMIKKFEEIGSLEVQSGRASKSIASTPVEDVTTALQEMKNSGVQMCSARGIARSLDIYVSPVHTILRNILQYPQTITHAAVLLAC